MKQPATRIIIWTSASLAVLLVIAAGVWANLRVIDGTHDDDRAGSLSPLLEPAGVPTRTTGAIVRRSDARPATRTPAAPVAPRTSKSTGSTPAPARPRPAAPASRPAPPPTSGSASSGSGSSSSAGGSDSSGSGSDDAPDVDDDHGGGSGVDDGDGDDD